jgi:multicomponent Na+:H+ antiporter subunit E
MKMFGWNLILALAWCAAAGELTIVNLAVGLLVGFGVVAWLVPGTASRRYVRHVRRLLVFSVVYAVEVTRSTLRVAWDVITPQARRRPGILAVRLDVTTDAEIFVLANLITFSPGTLALDVRAGRGVMIVHDMFVRDPAESKRHIKDRFERWVLSILR